MAAHELQQDLIVRFDCTFQVEIKPNRLLHIPEKKIQRILNFKERTKPKADIKDRSQTCVKMLGVTARRLGAQSYSFGTLARLCSKKYHRRLPTMKSGVTST